ncbi:hypothetical protein P7C70_g2598, partial [Phenoliferia sp. Uapishka_3]
MLRATLLVTLALLQACAALRQPYDYLKAAEAFLDGFINRDPIVANGNSPALAQDVVGRIDITSTFVGQELNTEYLYGLFWTAAQTTTTTLIPYITSQSIQALVIEPPLVYTSVIVQAGYPTINFSLPVQLDLTLNFDNDLLIQSYDVVNRRFAQAIDYILPQLVQQISKEINATAEEAANPAGIITKHAAIDICDAHEQFCVGENAQYTSSDACRTFITNELPFGQLWEGGQNSSPPDYLVSLHSPQIHCVHIGPSGGDMCHPHDYLDIVNIYPFNTSSIAVNATYSPKDLASLSKASLDSLLHATMHVVDPTTLAFYPIPAIAFFFILYTFAAAINFGLMRKSVVFGALSPENQRNTVTCTFDFSSIWNFSFADFSAFLDALNTLITTVALVLQVFDARSLAMEYSYAGIEAIQVAAVMVSELYIFELVYRRSMRAPLIAHHVFTLLAIISVFVDLTAGYHPATVTVGFLWLLQVRFLPKASYSEHADLPDHQATTEQSVFIGLFMYRMRYPERVTRLVLKFAAVQTMCETTHSQPCELVVKVTFATYLIVWWAIKLVHNTERPEDVYFSVIICVVSILLLLTQIYGSWAVWRIATKCRDGDDSRPLMKDDIHDGKYEDNAMYAMLPTLTKGDAI